MTVIGSTWFSSSRSTIGIVCAQTEAGERKFYMDKVRGVNQKADEMAIVQNGCKVYPEHLAAFLKRHSRGKA